MQSLWYTLPVELRSYIINYSISEYATLLDESEEYEKLTNPEHIWLCDHIPELSLLSFEWAYEIRRARWVEIWLPNADKLKGFMGWSGHDRVGRMECRGLIKNIDLSWNCPPTPISAQEVTYLWKQVQKLPLMYPNLRYFGIFDAVLSTFKDDVMESFQKASKLETLDFEMHETLIKDLSLDTITRWLGGIRSLTSLGLHLYLVNLSLSPSAVPVLNIERLELDGCFTEQVLAQFLRLFPNVKALSLFQYGYLPDKTILPIITDLSGQLTELSVGFNHPSSPADLINGLLAIPMPSLTSLGLEIDEFPNILQFMDAKMPNLQQLSFDVYETLAPLDEIEQLALSGKFVKLKTFKIISRFPSMPFHGPPSDQFIQLQENIPSTVTKLATKGIEFVHQIKTGMDA
ncbi:hypothetical protein M422DRAFT_241759 [Sphaerobolus stellatus SS14]|nr:hypothetical protein M422DRAFT_241759 [Sphaerobolus stellatus SS14]